MINGQHSFTAEQVLAYAIGNPSEGFGDRYKIFDEGTGRIIARLPARHSFLLTALPIFVIANNGNLQAGGTITAQYDVPPDAWYFDADRSDTMPFAVLLETALQPCGWFAAYLGSALTSDVDIKFRNLGGQATTSGYWSRCRHRYHDGQDDAGVTKRRHDYSTLSHADGIVRASSTKARPILVSSPLMPWPTKSAFVMPKVYQPSAAEIAVGLGRRQAFPTVLRFRKANGAC